MNYKLYCTNQEKDFEIECKFEAENFDHVMENVVLFLRGVGFHPNTINDYFKDAS